MDNNKINFEIAFAKQLVKLQGSQISSVQIPANILEALIEKKDLLWEKVRQYKEMPYFAPVIPKTHLEFIKQINCFLLPCCDTRDIYNVWFNGFFYNEKLGWDKSKITEPGFLIDVQSIEPSSLTLKATHDHLHTVAFEEIRKRGYTPANHIEAFSIAYFSELLKTGEEFCAINFTWGGFEFASIYKGGEAGFGVRWVTPQYNKKGEYQTPLNRPKVLIPVYQESI